MPCCSHEKALHGYLEPCNHQITIITTRSWQRPCYYIILDHTESIGKNVLWSKSKVQGDRQHKGCSYQLLQPVKEKNSHWLQQLAGHFDNPMTSTVIHFCFKTWMCVFARQNDPNSVAKLMILMALNYQGINNIFAYHLLNSVSQFVSRDTGIMIKADLINPASNIPARNATTWTVFPKLETGKN